MNSYNGDFTDINLVCRRKSIRFCDVFEDSADFLSEYKNSELYTLTDGMRIDDTYVKLTFVLLSSKNKERIIGYDVPQFKERLFTTMWEFAPKWIKESQLQKQIRDLNATEISQGTHIRYNHADNPSIYNDNDMSGTADIGYVNNQNTTTYEYAKIDALAKQIALLSKDVTEEYLSHFSKLFSIFQIDLDGSYYEFDYEGDEE